jgi:hypothetical protein
VPTRLVRQLLDQAVALLSYLAALLLLGAQLGLGLAQALLQFGGRPCKDKEEKTSTICKEDECLPGDPARLLSSRPESRGLHPAGALARPREG